MLTNLNINLKKSTKIQTISFALFASKKPKDSQNKPQNTQQHKKLRRFD